jgi:hypothetical protein
MRGQLAELAASGVDAEAAERGIEILRTTCPRQLPYSFVGAPRNASGMPKRSVLAGVAHIEIDFDFGLLGAARVSPPTRGRQRAIVSGRFEFSICQSASCGFATISSLPNSWFYRERFGDDVERRPGFAAGGASIFCQGAPIAADAAVEAITLQPRQPPVGPAGCRCLPARVAHQFAALQFGCHSPVCGSRRCAAP